jgi:hypothetical protein
VAAFVRFLSAIAPPFGSPFFKLISRRNFLGTSAAMATATASLAKSSSGSRTTRRH